MPADSAAVTGAEKQAVAVWKKQDKKARKEICLRISDEYLVYMNEALTAKSAWDTLQGIFESKASIGVVYLRRDLFRTIAEEGANMEEHVRKMRGLQQQLAARGEAISDKDFSNTLLTSLPASWSTFITAIHAAGTALTSETLMARILDEDASRKAGSSRQTALKSNHRGATKRSDGATKGKCHNCGKKGHYKQDCWMKGGGKEGQAPKWFKPKDRESAKKTEESDFAFISAESALISISAADWLADSAATTHIARNKSDFITYEEESSEIEGITPGATLHTQG